MGLTLPTAEAWGFSFRWDCAVVRRHRSSYFPSASIDSGVSRPTVLLLFTQAVEWLSAANLIHRIYRVEQIAKPIENYRDIDDFKVYISDMGLLCAQKEISAEDVFYMDTELEDFNGGMTENFVHIQLVRAGFKPCFWRNDKGTKEAVFIIKLGGKLIPIEVKSGSNVKLQSLNEYLRLFNPAWSIRISEKNFGFENNIQSIPLYATFLYFDSIFKAQVFVFCCFVHSPGLLSQTKFYPIFFPYYRESSSS